MKYKVIKSKYPGKCEKCGATWNEGEQFAWKKDDDNKSRKLCLDCYNQTQPLSQASPEMEVSLDDIMANGMSEGNTFADMLKTSAPEAPKETPKGSLKYYSENATWRV